MNNRIIYPTPDGGVAVIIPADCGLTIEQIAAKDVPPDTPYSIVNAEDIPTDRTFRDAWEKQGSAVGHNLVKCKNIAHDKRRAARAVELTPLDVEATIPAKAAQAEAKRQTIRDKYGAVQTGIDAASTVAELKSIVGSL